MSDPKFSNVMDAVLNGTPLDEAVQMKIRVAQAIDDPATSSRDLAALSKRQMELTREIEEMRRLEDEEAEDSGVSEDEEFDADEI